jgi:hypothetical protein
MYRYNDGERNKLYSLDFSQDEKDLILSSMEEVMDLLDLRPEKVW